MKPQRRCRRTATTPRRTGVAWLVAVLACPSAALTHHSQAPFFDQSRDVSIEGIVQKFDFRNPHAILYVEVVDNAGGTSVWELQFASVTILVRAGVTVGSFEPGERISAVGHPARNPASLALASVAVTKADGSEIVDPLRSGEFSAR